MEFGNRIVKYAPEYSVCTGCKSCEIVCSMLHDGVVSPERTRIRFVMGDLDYMMHDIRVCQQCVDHPCYDACPKKDAAMCIDERGVVYVNREECIGCKKCEKACIFEEPRVRVIKRDGKRFAVKCDLCRDFGGVPQCVKNCPAACLGLSADSLPDLSRPINAVEVAHSDSVFTSNALMEA
ncbi:MAG: hypothetical protein IKD70_05215 [Eggerthellaceae bacterium]|nr:hypothetical protein [Eggerthellaceae bacterium]